MRDLRDMGGVGYTYIKRFLDVYEVEYDIIVTLQKYAKCYMMLAIYVKRVVCSFLFPGRMTSLKEVIMSHQ